MEEGWSILVILKRTMLAGAVLLVSAAGAVYPAATGGGSAAAAPLGTAAVAGGGHGGYTVVSFCDVNARTPHERSILELAAMGIVSASPGGKCKS